MAVFLQILKIIGIVLLVLLALMLLGLLLFILVPMRYKVIGTTSEKDLTLKIRVSWLLCIFWGELSFLPERNMVIRIFGIPFYDRKRKRLKAQRRREKEEEKRRLAAAARKETEEEEDTEILECEEDEVEYVKTEAEGRTENAEITADTEDDEESGNAPENVGETAESGNDTENAEETVENDNDTEDSTDAAVSKKPPFDDWLDEKAERLGDRLDRILDRLEKLPEKLEDKLFFGLDKIDEMVGKYNYYERLLTSKGAADVYEFLKKHILPIVHACIPKRSDISLDICSEDPILVARLMQLYALCFPFLYLQNGKQDINISQDEPRLDADIRIRGSFMLLILIWNYLAIKTNRKCKSFIRRLRREED